MTNFTTIFASYKELLGKQKMTNYLTWIKWGIIAAIVAFLGFKVYGVYSNYIEMGKTIANQKSTIEEQKGTIGSLQQTNKDLSASLEIKDKSNKITEETATDLGSKNLSDTNKFSEIKDERIAKENAVKKNPVKKVVIKDKVSGKTVTVEERLTEPEVNVQISQIRIDTIWKAYCSSNKPLDSSTESCKSFTTA